MSPLQSLLFPNTNYASPDLFVNHMTFSFSQFVTYLRDHYLVGCVSDKNSSFSPDQSVSAVKLTTVCTGLYMIVSSSLMRVVFNGRLFLAAVRYFSIILFRAALIFCRVVNLHQGHGALFQAHNLSLHHLHDLPNEIVSAGCPTDLCMGLYLTDSCS